MAYELLGKRIAFLASDGVQQTELTEPWDALAIAGADLELIATEGRSIVAMDRRRPADSFAVDTLLSEADVGDYDGLVLPSGVVIRNRHAGDDRAARFVRAFRDQSKPVASINRSRDVEHFFAEFVSRFS